MMAVWSFLAGSKVGRWIAAAAGVLLAIVTMRAVWRREGRQAERAERAVRTQRRIKEADNAVRNAGWADRSPADRLAELRKRGL